MNGGVSAEDSECQGLSPQVGIMPALDHGAAAHIRRRIIPTGNNNLRCKQKRADYPVRHTRDFLIAAAKSDSRSHSA
jgi:hypothetical protein